MTQNGLDCPLVSQLIADQGTYVIKGWQTNMNFQGYPQFTSGTDVNIFTVYEYYNVTTASYQNLNQQLTTTLDSQGALLNFALGASALALTSLSFF